MNQLQIIKQPIEKELNQFVEIYDSLLTHPDPLLNQALQQIAQRKGKMMRPILTLLSAKLFGDIDKKTYFAAAAFEYLHNASLIHDDVVDDSDQRRGKPSVNQQFGNKAAVLMGDYMLALSLHASAETGSPQFLNIVSKAAGGLSDGELLQLETVFNQTVSEDRYFNVIKAKTAVLFAACAEGGAMMQGADSEQVQTLRRLGELIGLCFQIKDDIFDYFPNSQIGKPTGNDMQEGKITLPLLYALRKMGLAGDNNEPQKASERTSERVFSEDEKQRISVLVSHVQQRTANTVEISQLTQFAIQSGGIDYAYSRIAELASEAKSLLASYPSSPVKSALLTYVDYVAERDK